MSSAADVEVEWAAVDCVSQRAHGPLRKAAVGAKHCQVWTDGGRR